ncbi:MAG TPA: GatB/YqeY domain-containing protein [Streptosporangiaceae bacterium]|nr:GatB/YqeY domain-containing protein [Streptosporangiaceae bacterium]
MAELKNRLRADLAVSMKARDQLRTRTIRMALASVTNEEVAGKTARELSDDEVMAVLAKEAKKRRDAAEAFDAAGRAERAAVERAEGEVLATYLPAQLSDEELGSIVAAAIAETGAAGMSAMGQVMKVVRPQVAGRAEGGRVAAEVRRRLGQA